MAQELWEDVLVVGSGPVGATFARKLVQDHGRSVCVVDAGPYLSNRAGENLKNAEIYRHNRASFKSLLDEQLRKASIPTTDDEPIMPEAEYLQSEKSYHKSFQLKNFNPDQEARVNLDGGSVTYAVGGMGTHWTCATPRQHPTVERSDVISDEEWDKLYTEAEKLLMTKEDVFQHSIRHALLKEILQSEYAELKGAASPQNLPFAGYSLPENPDVLHWTGTDDVFGPLLDDPALQSRFCIKAEHLVEKLVFSAEGSAVDYAVVRDLRRDRLLHVHANQFVVAAGAILTPQILFNSGHRPRALGRYLCEQTMASTQVVLKRSIIEKCKTDERFTTQITDHVKKNPDDPIPISFSDPDPHLLIRVSEGRPWHCQVQQSFAFVACVEPPNVDRRTIVGFYWFGKTEPREDNYVTFSETIKDSMGMPQPIFHFVLSDDDRERNERMMQDMIRAGTALGEFLPESPPRFLPPGKALHITGTVRMGKEDDGKSVVDEFSKVWSVENLYLGGNGVIPTGNASNPTLTSVALAIRAANKMSQDASDKHTGPK